MQENRILLKGKVETVYQALYRKYRPQVFDDVVGQEHITTTLRNEIAAGRPAHAYLFMGSRGTGKTTCSKIVAKAVNCLSPREGNPCGECDICRGIDNGSVVDVVEIDAASNNGVDNIRDLRDEAGFTPNLAKYRVYIIDEVHMLSMGAFNALLKIMEEPPPHVIFILATTEAHKVPATILSRCQRFDFRRIPSPVIAARLEKVAAEEGIPLEGDAALLIARMADGGMRDALSLLDLCSSHGGPITVEAVREVCGLADQDYLFQLGDAIAGRDGGALLELLQKLSGLGVEYDRLCDQMIAHYRNLMVAKSSQRPEELILCLPEQLEDYRRQADRFRMGEIIGGLEVLQEAQSAMSRTPSRKTVLEMAAIRLCDPALALGKDQLLERISRLEAQVAALAAGRPAGQTAEGPRPAPARETYRPAKEAVPPRPPQRKPSGAEEEKPAPFPEWTQVLELLKQRNGPLHGFLAGSSAYLAGSRVLIDSRNTMFLNLVRTNAQAKEDIRLCIAQVTGKTCGIGPYTAPAPSAPAENSELDSLLARAKEAGVDVSMK